MSVLLYTLCSRSVPLLNIHEYSNTNNRTIVYAQREAFGFYYFSSFHFPFHWHQKEFFISNKVKRKELNEASFIHFICELIGFDWILE